MKILLPTVTDTEHFAARLFQARQDFNLIFLQGDLGAGKTTLVRGFLRAAGYQGAVKSPTFTLVEEYQLEGLKIVHFDLYRLSDPEELEWIGFSDYLDQDVLCFIEWPEMGGQFLPEPDLILALSAQSEGHIVEIIKVPENSQLQFDQV